MRGCHLTLSALLAAALLSMQSGPAGAAAPPAKTEPVAYRLSPELDAAGALTALKVEIRFREGPSGQTRLAWTKEWAGDSELSSHARDMKISGGEATADGPGAWVIRAAPGAPITASYRVVSAYDHDPTDEDSKQSKPVVRPIWFYAVGEALFAAPQGQEKSPATFVWDGAPKDFGFASDLEHLARPGRAAARAGTVDDVIESIVVGGRDLRTFERRYNGARVRVAMMGRYGFDDAAFANQVFQVLRVERDVWKDRASPFLVTMSPTLGAPGRISYGGTGRADAFALWVDTTTKMDGLRWLLAHEYFHTWNPKQLGDLGGESVEAAGYWFSEGFTDYYAWELMRRSHQFAPEAFAGQWNSMLRAYAVSPVRDKPNSLIVSDFWTSQAVQKLPYQRGAILAAVLERQARAHGTSLDAVLLEMRRLAARPGETRHADVLFPVAYRSVVGADLGDLLARHIVAGEPLALPADAFGRCFQIKTVEIAPFERGWDSAATRKADNVVTGLRDDSPAYAAGLRNGMKIIEFLEGDSDNSAVAVLLKVQPPEGPERLVRFFPAGKTRLPAQQLEPVPGCKG
jgi:predicted metalloprotease with PDZ domain